MSLRVSSDVGSPDKKMEKKEREFSELPIWEKFQSMFGAKFGGVLTEKDGISYWREKVMKYPWGAVEKALEELGREYDRDQYAKRPRIGRFQELVDKEMRAVKFDSPYSDGVKCSSCKNSGWRLGVWGQKSKMLISLREIKQEGQESCIPMIVPCSCEIGTKNIYRDNMQVTGDRRKWMRDNSLPYGMGDYGFREYVAKACE